MDDVVIEYKKPFYPVSDALREYLEVNSRLSKIQVAYEDLLRFSDYMPIPDKNGKDSLWLHVFYSQSEQQDLVASLNKIYTLLHSDGDTATLPFLTIDSIAFCTFGNSKPFRIRVRNILNDNYTHYYIKKVDASRIYGLELEDIVSPNRINFLVYRDTLIEEHILGIPGDTFIKEQLPFCNEHEKAQIAKEFVKFNERCTVGLLGDMRSYNYVVIPIHDFDQVVYRIRPIDFDQQSYEGKIEVYEPYRFKENKAMLALVQEKLKESSIEQYKKEVRSAMVKRITSDWERFNHLMEVVRKDTIAPQAHVDLLKESLRQRTYIPGFSVCNTMGEVIDTGFRFTIRNYRSNY
jgi:hypothetical protein